jgi:TolB-like protein/cytochrome c-type biogenesis protein CcmH/NrfG
MSFFHELKRRNVFRVAIAYVIVAWLAMQIIDVVLNNITAPDWIFQVLMLFLAIGLPFALIFAWAFELTPEGIKKEKEVDRSQSITTNTGRRLDYLIIGVLVIAVSVLLADKFLLTDAPIASEIVADDSASPLETTPSIAVLPFANMSADESSVYFSDGLADTVLHMLAQVPGLRVAARTSSFQFRGQSLDVAKIGEQLNVGAILEGSVQKSGDKIRVTAQLIDVSNGFHLWSGTFDRDLDDVFAIQDEIASEVVAALKVKLLGEDVERLNVDQTDNVDAYTEYLLAINDLNNINTENLKSAVNHLQEAIRLDPEYGRAYSALGRAYLLLNFWGSMNTTEALAAARDAASRALDISADSSEALAVLGLADLNDGNLESAGQLLNKAIENSPNDVVALNYYAVYLFQDARPDEAIAIYRQILRLDPLSESAQIGLAFTFGATQRFSEASETIARFLRIEPESANALSTQFFIETRQGNWAAAIASATTALAIDPDDPEGPGIIGQAYLALHMPEEASRWFDRAVEIDAQHPMSRAAPLWLNYYLQQNEDESYRLARELLEDRISNRHGSDAIALTVLIEHAARTDRHEAALELLDNLYPHLFDDPPHDLNKDRRATYFVGLALINSGDVDRGTYLMESYLDLRERYDEAYGVNRRTVAGRLVLGDTDAALDKLEGFAETKYFRMRNRLFLERSPVFDPIRDEPAFVALMDEYRRNAAEQRQILQAMNEGTSGH